MRVRVISFDVAIGKCLTNMATFEAGIDEEVRSYTDFLMDISAEELYEGLIGHGLIGEKLPPVFTSEPFFRYCMGKSHNFRINHRSGHGFVTYRYAQNRYSYRLLGIPNPMAYEHLCQKLRDNWENIRNYFAEMTLLQSHKVSRIHLRKEAGGSKILFNMNYKNWRLDGDPIPDVLLGAKYCVLTDIAKCFPSIYTHAIEWALAGKEIAKERRKTMGNKKASQLWESQIDSGVSRTTNNETHGILIGPHASNLISEIILCRIDYELSDKWRYVRHIDDFECYVATREEADEFVRDLDKSLMKYGLSRNAGKTKIVELPYGMQSKWVRALLRYPLPKDRLLRYPDVSAFMDYVIELERLEEDLAVYKYAAKMISSCSMTKNAETYFLKIFGHLSCIHPYLISCLEMVMTNIGTFDVDLIKNISDEVFSKSMQEGNYYSAYFALYFAVKYKFELKDYSNVAIIDSDDCLLKLFALMYCRKKNKTVWVSALCENASNLQASGEFEANWVFCYEALKADELESEDWIALKKSKVTFFDTSSFQMISEVNRL